MRDQDIFLEKALLEDGLIDAEKLAEARRHATEHSIDLVDALVQNQCLSGRNIALTKADLCYADEMFITGTGAEVCPVNEIDKRPVGDRKPGPITKQLIADFRAHTRSGEDLL